MEHDPKSDARTAAFMRRKAAKSPECDALAIAALLDVVLPHKGKPMAGYMPIRTEADPLPVMAAMQVYGPVAVPVIQAAGQALKFRDWSPFVDMVDGPFGAKIPVKGDWVVPEVVIVPLVAFDRKGGRLGYGGGFYDRTLELLRSQGPMLAIGYAFAAQEADGLPLEPTDQPLDLIVTDAGVIAPRRNSN